MKSKFFSLVIVLALISTSLALPTTSLGQCSDEEFACGEADGSSCIPLEWVCDNVKDCRRGKDEANCNYLHACPDGDFMCKSGECVTVRFKCDGRPDCSDGSDEIACLSVDSTQPLRDEPNVSTPVHHIFTKKVTCVIGEFHCEKSNKCISKYLVCNGKADCEYMEDEADCHVDCPAGGHQCEDGSGCYLSKCDGYKECNDGSDEIGCGYDDLPSMDAFFNDHFHGCGNDEFKCSVNECVPKAKLCDGVMDCKNGADEGGLCGDCASYDCAYKCRDSPKGPECYCPEGSFLTVDFKTCEQANPCADGYHLNGTTLCEVKHPSPLTDSASSSGWMTFFYFLLFLIASLVVTYCLVSKFYPEYIRIIHDRVQHRFSGLSPQLRRVNATFGKRSPVVPLRQDDVNAQVSSLATPTKSYSTTDLSKSSFLNPVFGSSPALAKGNSRELSPSLHKSSSADFKLNIEE